MLTDQQRSLMRKYQLDELKELLSQQPISYTTKSKKRKELRVQSWKELKKLVA